MTFNGKSIQSNVFDYSSLSQEKRQFVQEKTDEIKNLIRRTAQNVIDIGQKLLEVKEQVGHGYFLNWLKTEFNWSVSTATKMMQASEKFKNVNFTNLNFSPSALYLLAAPSVDDEIREEALVLAESGTKINYSLARNLIRHYKYTTNSLTQKDFILDLKKSDDNDNRVLAQTLKQTFVDAKSISIEETCFSSNSNIIVPMVDFDFFNHYLFREWLRASREKVFLSLILGNLANLHFYNNKLPYISRHESGQLLISILNKTLKRSTDLYTFYDEEKFLLLLSNTPLDGALQIAKTVKKQFEMRQSQISSEHKSLIDTCTLNLIVCSLVPSNDLSVNFLLSVLEQELINIQIQGEESISIKQF
ncbi:diguanylate cyclase [Gloeothece citriformis PCC 7424]|uniref:Diguanylate cyclase n=1 Tax=Gloeothece citriformis (strain PCC 7424) TaxID=65393 RepID=B7KKN2_GLOC7|nr:DUF3102 domain-containing protein [Gloeothece citriformis]ACK71001.1 diguanylate cyclase [Gloeothece citriformis PCC 7424]